MPIKSFVHKLFNKPTAISKEALIHSDAFTILHDDISANTLKVIEKLQRSGFMAYLVGGGVRDLLLRKAPKDFDVATNASPEHIRKVFKNCRLIGKRFRLAHVHFGREIIEVATFRQQADDHDAHQRSEHGIVTRDNVYGSLEDDAWRRDFTINALYYDSSNNDLVDYTGGFSDLENRLIRIIGDPHERYQEDPVRIIRAIRFAAKLDFCLEKKTDHAIKDSKQLLNHISNSRLYEEILKCFHGGYGEKVYYALIEYDIFGILFPQTMSFMKRHNMKQNHLVIHTLRSTDQRIHQQKPFNPAFLLAALLWQPITDKAKKYEADGMSTIHAYDKAISLIVQNQRKHVAVPKRLMKTIREIYFLQLRLPNRSGKRAFRLLRHPRFRAGYDFLCIRAQSGEASVELADWWTLFQDISHNQQNNMVKELMDKK